ncbi:MAG: hypothetical protein E6K73_13565 [Candidatus Eisenbacteria bacterium]|jgi:hypothetical protein|uniref:Uncharacterized protein n=1 Tax=Eiseniibacteriota bacterium TaxID=2212470 RepID=A0A538S815_UNCEI|nr:MAG: hypothetical protein E6K73_13565 [Candidatus Eisenbacteria bacterium]
MHAHRWILVFAAAGLLAGCGDHSLVLNVDVLSYLDPQQTKATFGPVPSAPEGLYSGEQSIVSDAEINLVGGVSSVTEVHNVSISMSAIACDSTGAGTDTLRIYMSDTNTDPTLTPPVLEVPIVMTPGVTDTTTVEASGDDRLAQLFSGKNLRVAITTALRGPVGLGTQSLNGWVRISALDCVLVAGRKGT